MVFRLFVRVMAVLIFSIPCVSLAQQSTDADQAYIDAKNDAQNPVPWTLGAFLTAAAGGCIGGSVIVLSSQLHSPKPPSHRLVGKSPEYIRAYIETYERDVKRKRLFGTSAGCISGSLVTAMIWPRVFNINY